MNCQYNTVQTWKQETRTKGHVLDKNTMVEKSFVIKINLSHITDQMLSSVKKKTNSKLQSSKKLWKKARDFPKVRKFNVKASNKDRLWANDIKFYA